MQPTFALHGEGADDAAAEYATARTAAQAALTAGLTTAEMAASAAGVVRGKARYVARHFQRWRAERLEADGFAAKGMLAVPSRAHVVQYCRRLRRLLRHTDLRVYGAFSGTVAEGGGGHTTESGLNSGALADAQLVVVCNKLETGYDDPSLQVSCLC